MPSNDIPDEAVVWYTIENHAASKVIEAAIAQAKFMSSMKDNPLTDDTAAMFRKANELQEFIWSTTNAVREFQKVTP